MKILEIINSNINDKDKQIEFLQNELEKYYDLYIENKCLAKRISKKSSEGCESVNKINKLYKNSEKKVLLLKNEINQKQESVKILENKNKMFEQDLEKLKRQKKILEIDEINNKNLVKILFEIINNYCSHRKRFFDFFDSKREKKIIKRLSVSNYKGIKEIYTNNNYEKIIEFVNNLSISDTNKANIITFIIKSGVIKDKNQKSKMALKAVFFEPKIFRVKWWAFREIENDNTYFGFQILKIIIDIFGDELSLSNSEHNKFNELKKIYNY